VTVADAPLAADARVADAPVNLGDAPRPDAHLPPDSGPPEDAPLPADASPPTADARPGDAGTCLPTCWTDLVTGLQANCIPSGACTTGGSFPTFATCYANGVKLVSSIMIESFGLTWLTPSDTTCYSLVISVDLQGSTTVLKNAAGTTVGTIVVNLNDPLIQQYTCGSNPPITVDLTRPECAGMGGGPDAGMGCTPNASCTP